MTVYHIDGMAMITFFVSVDTNIEADTVDTALTLALEKTEQDTRFDLLDSDARAFLSCDMEVVSVRVEAVTEKEDIHAKT